MNKQVKKGQKLYRKLNNDIHDYEQAFTVIKATPKTLMVRCDCTGEIATRRIKESDCGYGKFIQFDSLAFIYL